MWQARLPMPTPTPTPTHRHTDTDRRHLHVYAAYTDADAGVSETVDAAEFNASVHLNYFNETFKY